MEAQEETSEVDSESILQSELNNSSTDDMDYNVQIQPVELKRQALQDKLELCIMELRKLCIREAELTGQLSPDYPLLHGERSPQIRRRIGAAFKLDEQSILPKGEDSELCSLEAKMALQQQIFEAMRRLCQEEHHSKSVKKSRVQQCKREEQKLKELQQAVGLLRITHSGSSSPRPGVKTRKHQDNPVNRVRSSSPKLDKEELSSQLYQRSAQSTPIAEPHSVTRVPSPRSRTPNGQMIPPSETSHVPQHLQHLCQTPSPERDPAFILNTYGKEASINQPYQKYKSHSNSNSSSPAATPVLPRLQISLAEPDLNQQIHTMRHSPSNSMPSTPEMPQRRGHYLSVPSGGHPCNAECDQGRFQTMTGRLTPDLPPKTPMGSPLHDFGSEHYQHSSASSHIGSAVQRQSHAQYERYPYTRHPLFQSYVAYNYYNNSANQVSPSVYRGYVDEARYHDLNMRRTGSRYYPPHHFYNGQHNYSYEEAPLQQQGYRMVPQRVNLSRVPSFREYPQQSSRASVSGWLQNNSNRSISTASSSHHGQGPWHVW